MTDDKQKFKDDPFEDDLEDGLGDNFFDDAPHEEGWDDDVFDEQDMDEFEEHPQDVDDAKKKRSDLFNKLIIGAGALVALFFIVPQFTGGKSQTATPRSQTPATAPQQPETAPESPRPGSADAPAPAAQQASQQASPPLATATTPSPRPPLTRDDLDRNAQDQNAEDYSGLLNNAAALEKLEASRKEIGDRERREGYEIDLSNSELLDAPVTLVMELGDSDEELLAPPVDEDLIVENDELLIPTEEDALIDDAEGEESDMTDATLPDDQPEMAGEEDNTAETALSPAEIQRVEEMVGTVLTRLDSLEQKISAVENAPAPSLSEDDRQALADAFAMIEKRLDRVDKKIATQGQASGSSAKTATKTTTAAKPVKPKPQIRINPPAKPNVAWASVGSLLPVSENTDWVLKAAQPSEAYVSQAGQPGMVRVRPGDVLTGLGTVKAIYILNGRWIIEGTDAFIAQQR